MTEALRGASLWYNRPDGHERTPDLAVSGIVIPGAYGASAHKGLENAAVAPGTPVVFVTSVIRKR